MNELLHREPLFGSMHEPARARSTPRKREGRKPRIFLFPYFTLHP